MRKILLTGFFIFTAFVCFSTSLMTSFEVKTNDELVPFDDVFHEYFNTRIAVRVWGFDSEQLETILDGVRDVFEEYHQLATRFDDYEGVVNVKTINDNPETTHTVHPDLIEMLLTSIEYYNHPLGGQKFNIAMGAVFSVWDDYRTRCISTRNEAVPDCEVPSMSELEAVNINNNPNDIVIDETANTVWIPDGMVLDLGAIAKGFGAKRAGEYLRSHPEIQAFMVDAGASNIEFYGDNPHPDRNHWVGRLRNPFFPTSLISNDDRTWYARIALESGQNIVTSGDYERYYTVDGQNFHHLIDPDTLMPAWHMRGITVVSDDPALGDIYSTIAFVLPLEEAIAFIDDLEDVEAIWVDEDGGVHFSENIEELYVIEYNLPYVPDGSSLEPENPDDPSARNWIVYVFGSALILVIIAYIGVVIIESKKDKIKPE